MALSEYTINFNYNQAIAKADELDTQANNLENNAVNEMGSIMASLRRDWEGNNSTEYVAKCTTVKSNLEAIVAQMRTVAAGIRTMAKNVYDAEMRALAIARAEEAARRERERQEREQQQTQ